MKSNTNNLTDSLYTSWTIAAKDLLDALKNKNTRLNLLLMVGFVVLFYWLSTLRPFDKEIDVVLFDEGNSSLDVERADLQDGYSVTIETVSSLEEMKRGMRYEKMGLVLPSDFDQKMATGEELSLSGYILWHHRTKVGELETKYSQKFSELLDRPVRVEIDDNFVIPNYDVEAFSAQTTIFYVILWGSLSVIPYLLIEEKQTKTLDALLVSPAGPGEVILGKAIAGLILVLSLSVWFFVFYWVYVIHWGLALLSILLTALFSIGLGLIIGSVTSKQQHLNLINLVVVVVLFLPALFAQEAFLNSTLKALFPLIPSSALVRLIYFSFSENPPLQELLVLLAIAIVSIALIISIVIWQVRRSDR